MPDPTFKIDSTTVLSKSGTTVSLDSGVSLSNSAGAGLYFIKKGSVSSASSISITDCFSSSYDIYKLFVTLGTWTTSSGYLKGQFIKSDGTTESGSIYNSRAMTISSGSDEVSNFNNNTTFLQLCYNGNTILDVIGGEVTIINPFNSHKTVAFGHVRDNFDQFGGSVNSTTSYTGFLISTSTSTMSCTVSVFGIKN